MAAEEDRKLFVAGLPDAMTEEVLRQLFEATGGQVVSVSLPKDRATGRPRGFGFVTMATPEDAERARRELDGSLQAGQSISVRPFSSEPPRRGEGAPGAPRGGQREDRGQDRTLYVGNLPYDTSQAELEELFSARGAGVAQRMHLPLGPDNRMRGFGFVTMPSVEAANQALVALRDAEVRGRRLMINIAHPRAERPAGGGYPADRGGAPGGGRPWDSGRAGGEPRSAAPYPGDEVPEDRGGGGGRAAGGSAGKRKKGRGEGGAGASGGQRRGRSDEGRWDKRRDWDDD